MCGIVGYIGNKKASPILINGLLRLEYRGYDSAGIATMENDTIKVMKNKGRVNNLYELDGINDLVGTIGIAHTRWATHGKPSKENSHPHMDNSKSFAVVHNGIIENYNELKNMLIEKGYRFLSATDTEVIPNLIHYHFEQDKINDEKKVLRAVKNACKDLKGSYAIEILSKYNKDKMIVTRKDSPLVIGKGNSENYLSSDIPAILSYTKDFYLLDDYEIVELSRDEVKFYNEDLKEIKKPIKSIEWGAASAEKNGYEDFMLKEIYEQPRAIRETVGAKLDNGSIEIEGLDLSKEYLESLNKIYIVACGTAMHAGLVAKTTIEKLCKIPVEVDIASEFRYREPLIDEKTLSIYISQSGETADTIAALKLAKAQGAKTLAISNVIGSSITREADYSIYTHAGPEIAVASTKAYTSQVTLLTLVALYCAEILGKADAEKVLESVIKTKPDSKIIKIDIQQVNLSSNMNSNEKTALTDSLNAFKNSYKKLYDLSVSLDTSIISEVNCKLSINELSNSVNTIYENYNTIFNQNLSSSLIQIKLALSELKTQLSSLSQTSNSTSLSSQIKYTYCKIIEIFKTLANSLSNN